MAQQNQLQVMDSADFDFLQRVWGFSTFSCILVDTLGFFSNIFWGKNKTLLDLSTIFSLVAYFPQVRKGNFSVIYAYPQILMVT